MSHTIILMIISQTYLTNTRFYSGYIYFYVCDLVPIAILTRTNDIFAWKIGHVFVAARKHWRPAGER